jgi:hypothetical protein
VQSGDDGQSQVDTRRNAGAGCDLALKDDSLRRGFGAVGAQLLIAAPMGGGLQPVEKSGRAKQQRSATDRGRVGGVLVRGADPFDHRSVVLRQASRGASAGNEKDVGMGDLLEGVVDVEVQLAVLVVKASAPRGAHDDLGVGKFVEHLVRPDRVENSEPWKESDGDLHERSLPSAR